MNLVNISLLLPSLKKNWSQKLGADKLFANIIPNQMKAASLWIKFLINILQMILFYNIMFDMLKKVEYSLKSVLQLLMNLWN